MMYFVHCYCSSVENIVNHNFKNISNQEEEEMAWKHHESRQGKEWPSSHSIDRRWLLQKKTPRCDRQQKTKTF